MNSSINNDFGTVTGPGTLQLRRLLPGTLEKVWEYLVDSEKRGTWFARGQIEPRVGGKVELFFLHKSLTPVAEPTPAKYTQYEEGVSSHGTVLRWEPPRVFAYRWAGGKGECDTDVTFELTPQDGKVLLTITHTRLPSRVMMVEVAGGWHAHANILVERLEGRTPGPFWSRHAAVREEYERRIPAENPAENTAEVRP